MHTKEEKIRALIAETPHLPPVFEILLSKKSVFAEDEEIIEMIFLEREGYKAANGFFEKEKNFLPASLVIATSYGITIVQEGGNELFEKMYGYKITHLLFDKISSLQLDVCLLSGKLTISCSSGDPESVIHFNTAKYYREFESFVDAVRRKIFLSGRR